MKQLRIFLFFLLLLGVGMATPSFTFAAICSPISTSPTLFQINRTKASATLYITPVNSATSYTIIYGLSSGDERFSSSFDYGQTTGAITYTINGLEEKTPYYFAIRANNDCSKGPFSEWVPDPLAKNSTAALPVVGSESVIAAIAVSSIIALLGIMLVAL